MSAPQNIRTAFIFLPSQEEGEGWDIGYEDFTAAIRESFPDPFLELRVNVLPGMDVLDFKVDLTAEIVIIGRAMLASPAYSYILLDKVTAGQAALFTAWIRDHLLPAPTHVEFGSGAEAMEIGIETFWTLPQTGDAAEIETVMREYHAAAGVE